MSSEPELNVTGKDSCALEAFVTFVVISEVSSLLFSEPELDVTGKDSCALEDFVAFVVIPEVSCLLSDEHQANQCFVVQLTAVPFPN